ncbi:cache domain-containing protein [Aurantimonas marina]|uniref:cache domain-containing protein n=1 Tax=Aurantimonas marina TaxID=2780508 RepID=UPI0019D2B4CE|nr:cache domain-containing protein [Aurantimonas marina]
MWSCRTVLTSTLVGLQVAALLAVLALTYFASQNVLLSYAEQLTERVAQDTTTFTENFLDPADDAAELSQRLAERAVVSTDNPAILTRYFYEVLRSRADFAGIFYGAADGSFIYVNRDDTVDGAAFRTKLIDTEPTRSVRLEYFDAEFSPVTRREDDADPYDPRTRPWYVKALERRTVIWTEPYIFFSSRRPGITVATPVFDEESENIRGAVGIDIEIGALSQFLDGLEVGENGSAAIVSQSGDVIAHREASAVLALDGEGGQRFAKVAEIGDPALVQAVFSLPGGLESVTPGETRLTRFQALGESWRGAVRRLAGSRTPWVVVTYLPESDILGPLQRVRNIGLVVVAIVAVMTAIFSALLARALTKPIKALAAQASHISKGEFDDTPLPSMRMKELDETGQAMRRATSWLRDYRRENETLTGQLREAGRVLERRVEERTEQLAHANRELEEANRNTSMLAHELDHRVKNLFAITSSLVSLAASHATTPQEVADEARGRINALARAHSDTQGATETRLASIVKSVLEPYAGTDDFRINIAGEPLTVSRSNVTPIGLILYELATNAAKYGALGHPGGQVDVTWECSASGVVTLVWSERSTAPAGDGGQSETEPSGFGSIMLEAMAHRLDATVERAMTSTGLRVTLTMKELEEYHDAPHRAPAPDPLQSATRPANRSKRSAESG